MLKQLVDEVQYILDRMSKLERVTVDPVQVHQVLIRGLCTIPGVDCVGAWTMIAEVGTDMGVFGDAAHLCSWAAVCPGNNETAGKRQSGRTGKGNRVRATSPLSVRLGPHSKGNYVGAQFYRIRGRRGEDGHRRRGHHLLVTAFHIIAMARAIANSEATSSIAYNPRGRRSDSPGRLNSSAMKSRSYLAQRRL